MYGSRFRRVPIHDEARRGLLGQGSILALTSHAERTSPVVRGKWILENLMGLEVPPPPPDVPPLPEAKDGEAPKTMREQMAEHRANPVCASCHKTLDPIGFSMENFDAVGAWRTQEAGVPIDASGELGDGTKVNGVVELRRALLSRPENFASTVVEKLMIYALGARTGRARYAPGPHDCAERRARKLSVVEFDPRCRPQHAVPYDDRRGSRARRVRR